MSTVALHIHGFLTPRFNQSNSNRKYFGGRGAGTASVLSMCRLLRSLFYKQYSSNIHTLYIGLEIPVI